MTYEERLASPQMRKAYQVGYSIQLLGEICAAYRHAQDELDTVYSVSMLDAFYVHTRLLAEFLLRKQKDSDFGPRDFIDGWVRPRTESADRLDEYWHVASKYVVHFSDVRVPPDLDDLADFEVSAAALSRMARDAFAVMSVFIAQLESETAQGDELTIDLMRVQFLRNTLEAARRQVPAS